MSENACDCRYPKPKRHHSAKLYCNVCRGWIYGERDAEFMQEVERVASGTRQRVPRRGRRMAK